ncbi:MAG: hypothetical protein KAR13_14620 [Desulfobulbaceae bacterium]|nr:hypothetical protein [Desulfobulbaceae bacterium]
MGLPVIHNIESLPDPKQILHDLLCSASGHTSKRRLKRLSVNRLAFRVSEFTSNYAFLRELAAFRNLEEELLEIIAGQNRNS